MTRRFEYEIAAGEGNQKISSYLKGRGYSAHILTQLRHTQGSIFLNGSEVHMNELLSAGDSLSVVLTESISERVIPTQLPLDIVFEDEDILVVNKPAGMPSHPSRGVAETTLGNAVTYYFMEKGEERTYRCVNRLDKNTSGLTIIAKNALSGAILYEQVKSRAVSRTYTAIASGSFDSSSGRIDLPICRVEEGSVLRHVDEHCGQRAVTNYEVVAAGGGISVLRLQLETGRTHQIRVHMAHIGHPLLGDHLYNPENHDMARHALHAGEIAFTHPISGEEMHFEVKMPQDMMDVLEKLGVSYPKT